MEAYEKLNSVMEGGGRGDDSQEIAAFMRMFMDMLGISENDSIPAGTCMSYTLFSTIYGKSFNISLNTTAMTFGMMFGPRPAMEEWSTDDEDEDDDGDYDYDDEREIEELPDEAPNPSVSTSTGESNGNGQKSVWEPQVKQYSNMNLKDQICRERVQSIAEVLPLLCYFLTPSYMLLLTLEPIITPYPLKPIRTPYTHPTPRNTVHTPYTP